MTILALAALTAEASPLAPFRAVADSDELAKIDAALGQDRFSLAKIDDFGLAALDGGSRWYTITYTKTLSGVTTTRTYYGIGKATFVAGSNLPVFAPVFCFDGEDRDAKCKYFSVDPFPTRP